MSQKQTLYQDHSKIIICNQQSISGLTDTPM